MLILSTSRTYQIASLTVFPCISLMLLYSASLFHQRLMPFLLAFFLGFFYDCLTATPLGFHALLNVFFLLIIRWQLATIKYHSFIGIWVSFAFLAVFYHAVFYFFYSFSVPTLPHIDRLLFETLLAIVTYPFFHIVLIRSYSFYLRKASV